MTITLGIETFQCARSAVVSGVLTIAGRATPVRSRMLDSVLADNSAGPLRRGAGRLIATLSGVVAQLRGMVAPVSSTIAPPCSLVPSVGSLITLIRQTIPATACTPC
jgi:hypothetical protein